MVTMSTLFCMVGWVRTLNRRPVFVSHVKPKVDLVTFVYLVYLFVAATVVVLCVFVTPVYVI